MISSLQSLIALMAMLCSVLSLQYSTDHVLHRGIVVSHVDRGISRYWWRPHLSSEGHTYDNIPLRTYFVPINIMDTNGDSKLYS